MPFRITSILVASDLSESAREVLRAASALAALTEADFHVVHAVETSGTEDAGGEEQAVRSLQEQLAGSLPRTAQIASTRVTAGRGDEVILRRAEEVHADLLVIGPHRDMSGTRRALGTTADRLVLTSDVACLIVHTPLSLPLRRVLVPSDLSDAARGALDMGLIWACALRMPTGRGEATRIHVLHVIPERPAQPEADRVLQEEVAAAGERTGCAAPLRVSQDVVVRDSAATEILRRAEEDRVDLLVLGTHGESGHSRDSIGSVSSAVARQAECAVLLVPPGLWRARQAREARMRESMP